jgi:hypothetical protein
MDLAPDFSVPPGAQTFAILQKLRLAWAGNCTSTPFFA